MIDTGIEPSFLERFDLGNVQALIAKFSEDSKGVGKQSAQGELLNRCNGLESIKGGALCRLSVLYNLQGKDNVAEKKLCLAATLPLSLKDKSIYYSSLAKLKLDQFFKANSSVDRVSIFEEAVLGVPFSDPVETAMKKKSAKVLAQEKTVKKLEDLLKEAFSSTSRFGSPGDLQMIGHSLLYLLLFRAFVLQVPITSEEILYSLYYLGSHHFLTVEFPKSLYSLRQSKNTESIAHDSEERAWKIEFTRTILEKIPKDLLVCTLNCDPQRNLLYITRIENGKASIFKLPLLRAAAREGEVNGCGLSFSLAHGEFEAIMKINKETTSNAKYCVEKNDRKLWKETREDLNLSLEKFLNRIESEWLGGFKVIYEF